MPRTLMSLFVDINPSIMIDICNIRKDRARGIVSHIGELKTGVQTHCVTAVAFGAFSALVTALQAGWKDAVLHVSYCSTAPWPAGRPPSGPPPGSARCWVPRPAARSSAISLQWP